MSLDVLNLLLVLLAALAGGWVARRFNYPSILGELVAGIVFGPPLIGLLQTDDALSVIGKLGVVLLMLYIGLHLDPSSLGKAAKPGALAALGGFLVPAGLGFGLMMLVEGDVVAASFVAVAMGVTSLATKSRILVDLGILNTRVAHVLMAGALFSDVAALIIFATLLSFAATGAIALGAVVTTTLQALAFFVGTLIIGTRVLPWVGERYLVNRRFDPSTLFLIVVSFGLAFAAIAYAIDLHEILGAFLAGLFIREGVLSKAQLAEVENRARNVSVGLLAPVFFVTAGFQVSFDIFTESALLLVGIVVLATVGKVVGTAIFYLPTGHGFREGIAVGSGMNGRGAVEIIVAELALEAGIISGEVFSILVFMAIFTTATVPVLLTKSVEWLRSRGELVAEEREGILFVGAGPLARRIAAEIVDEVPVTMIDTNHEHLAAAAALTGVSIVDGSGMDDAVLESAGAEHARVLVAVTSNSEVNLLSARVARRWFGIPHIHVALTQDAPASMRSVLEELEGHLLFGRPIDLASWDVDVDRDQVRESRMPASELGDSSDRLPLLLRRSDESLSFSVADDLPGDVVVALERDTDLPKPKTSEEWVVPHP